MLETFFWSLLILLGLAAIVGFTAMAFLIMIMNATATDHELDYLDD